MKARSDSAWICGALSATRLNDLASALKFLPGDRNRRLDFLAKVNEEIDVYLKLAKPHVERAKMGPDRLATFSKATVAFHKAFIALHRDDLRAIQVELLMMRRRRTSDREDVHVSERQLEDVRSTMKAIEAAGEVALSIATAAGALTKAKKPAVGRRDGSGSPIDNADRSLIKSIAEIYAAVFGERPSPAENGVFRRALVEILKVAEVKTRPKQKRLSKLIADSMARNLPAPKRGPKARSAA
jgi:hypothetical protein